VVFIRIQGERRKAKGKRRRAQGSGLRAQGAGLRAHGSGQRALGVLCERRLLSAGFFALSAVNVFLLKAPFSRYTE
jgi:hypothetical protein